jgi:hypothetical protein
MAKQHLRVSLIALGLLLFLAPLAGATTYTQDPNIADFTSQIVEYSTLSNFSMGDASPSPFTPTSAELATNGFRAWSGGTVVGLTGTNWIVATFSSPQANIVVFPNIDHLGAAYDGYQYTIYGTNSATFPIWTPLFDAVTVTGAGEPFTLGTFTGTAPTSVNNIVNGGCGEGCVGYEATFNFSQAYQFYAFGASTAGVNGGNIDQELSGVGTVPEPGSLLLFASGLPWLLTLKRRKRNQEL